MDGMNGTEAHDAPQPDVVAEMVDAALATRPGPVRTSPYDDARQEATEDLELAAEWQMASDALLADENQALRMLARQRTDERTHTAWLESQLADARRKKHAAEARVVALECENAALREERDTLAAKLDAATARLAERENAALVADATDVCAGFSAAALYRMYTLEKRISEERRRAVERLTARLAERENAALVADAADIGLDDAHEDDDATPATLGDRRQQETRSIEWTPPTRSKPDAAA